MKVKLIDGVKRWSFRGFKIVRDQVKECPDDVFYLCNGRLEIVEEPKKKSRGRKKTIKKEEFTPILEDTSEPERAEEEIDYGEKDE